HSTPSPSSSDSAAGAISPPGTLRSSHQLPEIPDHPTPLRPDQPFSRLRLPLPPNQPSHPPDPRRPPNPPRPLKSTHPPDPPDAKVSGGYGWAPRSCSSSWRSCFSCTASSHRPFPRTMHSVAKKQLPRAFRTPLSLSM